MKFTVEIIKLAMSFGSSSGYVATFHGWKSDLKRTAKEASENLEESIRNAADGHYNPRIVQHKNITGVLTRDPVFGWGMFTLTHNGETAERTIYPSSSCNSFQQQLNTLKMHVAMTAYEQGDINKPLPSFLSPEQQDELTIWARIQERYLEALNRMNKTDAWDFATRNPARPELWKAETCNSN